MKRDMALVRRILIAIEDADQATLGGDIFVLDGVDPATVGEHLDLLVKGGYVEGHEITAHGALYPQCLVQRLTWKGHEFIDAIRHDTVWAKVRAKVEEQGGNVPLELVKLLGMQILKAKLGITE